MLRLLLLTTLFELASVGHSPTIQMRITDLGLDFISQLINKILSRKHSIVIPFIEVPDPFLPMNITNVTIEGFVPPNLKVKPKPPHGVQTRTSNGSLQVHASFTTFVWLLFHTVTVTGEADANASNFIVNLETDVLTKDLHPVFEVRNCSVDIGNISIATTSESRLFNTLSMLQRFFIRVIVSKISAEVSLEE
uniref:BPI1 domain-containing protein n=1 Tax=Elaeophora elaphi TaxID=1147741 RepID=A0A0R3RP94_9BILA